MGGLYDLFALRFIAFAASTVFRVWVWVDDLFALRFTAFIVWGVDDLFALRFTASPHTVFNHP